MKKNIVLIRYKSKRDLGNIREICFDTYTSLDRNKESLSKWLEHNYKTIQDWTINYITIDNFNILDYLNNYDYLKGYIEENIDFSINAFTHIEVLRGLVLKHLSDKE